MRCADDTTIATASPSVAQPESVGYASSDSTVVVVVIVFVVPLPVFIVMVIVVVDVVAIVVVVYIAISTNGSICGGPSTTAVVSTTTAFSFSSGSL